MKNTLFFLVLSIFVAFCLIVSCNNVNVYPDKTGYTLTLQTSGGGSISSLPEGSSGKYDEGTLVTLTAVPDTGYVFDHWEGDLSGAEASTTIEMTRDKTVTAVFILRTCTLTLTTAGMGSGTATVDPDETSFLYGTEITLTATSDTNKYFVNWQGDIPAGRETENPIVLTIIDDWEISAVFSNGPALVVGTSTDSSGTGTVTRDPDSDEYSLNQSVDVTATADADSVFSGWQGDVPSGEETTNPVTLTMDSSKTLYAQFAKKPVLTITTTSGSGTGTVSISPDKTYYDFGESVTLTPSAGASSVFDCWSGDVPSGHESDNPLEITMDSDKDISAVFLARYDLSVTLTGDGSGSVSPMSGTYTDGETVTLSATANAGSTFAGYSGDYTSYDEEVVVTMDSDKTISAEFCDNKWTIMVYLDADNDLESFGVNDFNEMEASNLNGSGINVIVLMDRIAGESTNDGNWTNTRLYQIKYDSGGENLTTVSKRLASTELGLTATGSEELNMGNPNTAINFIDYCQAEHPADNYAFIIWNHGDGWRKSSITANHSFDIEDDFPVIEGFNVLSKTPTGVKGDFKAAAYDQTAGDSLHTQEIGTLLNGQGIDVVGFDLCLGAMIEVAYEIKDSANYMVASEESEPGDGWEYDDVFNNFKASGGLSEMDLVNAIVDAYEIRYTGQVGTTLSGIDLSKIDDVMTALNAFSNVLSGAITSSVRQSLVRYCFTSYSEDFYSIPGDLNIDLYDAAYQVLTANDYADTEAQNLMDAVDAAVVAEWHDTGTTSFVENTDSRGLAIHLIPLDSTGAVTGYHRAYVKDYTTPADYPLSFVANSTWVYDYDDSSGLMYQLWYKQF